MTEYKMSGWKRCTKCGKERIPVVMNDDPYSVLCHLNFMENNPKELCLECWTKETERSRD